MQNKKLIITKDNSSKNAPNKTDTIIVKVNTDAKSLSNLKNQSIKKSDVSSATTKTNRMAGVEKNGAVNKGTAFINATFNVNLAKKALHSYIRNTLSLDIGTINAQYPYTAIAEFLVQHIVRSSGKFSAKSAKKADLYEINFENIKRGIRESHEYGIEIKALVDTYNPIALNYISTFFDTEKALRVFIETKTFTNTTNIHYVIILYCFCTFCLFFPYLFDVIVLSGSIV